MTQVMELASAHLGNAMIKKTNTLSMDQNSLPFGIYDKVLLHDQTGALCMLLSKKDRFFFIGKYWCLCTNLLAHTSDVASCVETPSHLMHYVLLAYICGFTISHITHNA